MHLRRRRASANDTDAYPPIGHEGMSDASRIGSDPLLEDGRCIRFRIGCAAGFAENSNRVIPKVRVRRRPKLTPKIRVVPLSGRPDIQQMLDA